MATSLFKYPIMDILQVVNRVPINTNNDDDHYEVLMGRQEKADKKYNTLKNFNSFPMGSTSGSMRGWRTMYPLYTKVITTMMTGHIEYGMKKTGCLITRNIKNAKAPTTRRHTMTF